MSVKSLTLAAVAAASFAVPAFADTHIMIHDPYARSAGKAAKAGAAFMTIMNHGDEADRLISVASDAAARVELHTHKEISDGVMQMMHVPEGFEIAAGDMLMLERGGHHVMMMGLTESFEQGKVIEVTLTFEKAGDVVVEVPVDLKRKGGHGDHKMSH